LLKKKTRGFSLSSKLEYIERKEEKRTHEENN